MKDGTKVKITAKGWIDRTGVIVKEAITASNGIWYFVKIDGVIGEIAFPFQKHELEEIE